MENITIYDLFDLKETIAAELFAGAEYPWEVLPKIKDFIIELGNSLPEDRYEKRGENIWIAKSAKVAPTACLNGPLIIDEEVTEIINSCYARAKQLLTDNRDILEAMKDALLKYETIDASQIDDLMNRRPVRPPELSGGSSSKDSNKDNSKDNGAGGDKPAESKPSEAPKADAQPSEAAQADAPKTEAQASEPKAEAPAETAAEAPSSEPSAPAEPKSAEPSQPASSGWPYNTPSGKRDDNK